MGDRWRGQTVKIELRGLGKGLDVGDEVNTEHHWPRDPVTGDITSRGSLNP